MGQKNDTIELQQGERHHFDVGGLDEVELANDTDRRFLIEVVENGLARTLRLTLVAHDALNTSDPSHPNFVQLRPAAIVAKKSAELPRWSLLSFSAADGFRECGDLPTWEDSDDLPGYLARLGFGARPNEQIPAESSDHWFAVYHRERAEAPAPWLVELFHGLSDGPTDLVLVHSRVDLLELRLRVFALSARDVVDRLMHVENTISQISGDIEEIRDSTEALAAVRERSEETTQ